MQNRSTARATTLLFEWRTPGAPTTPSVAGDEQQELSFTAAGDLNGVSCFGRQLGHFFQN